MKIARSVVSDFGLTNVEFIVGDSLKVLPNLLPKITNLQAAYIDGNHSYKYSMGEFRMIEAAIKGNGLIFFDDANKLHPDGYEDGGVPKTVTETGGDKNCFARRLDCRHYAR